MIKSYINVIDTTNIIGTGLIGYGVENLLDPWVNLKFKAVSQIVEFRTKIAVPVGMIGIANHNFTSNASVRIDYYSDVEMTNNIGLDQFTAVEGENFIELTTVSGYAKITINNILGDFPELGYLILSETMDMNPLARSTQNKFGNQDKRAKTSAGNNNVRRQYNYDNTGWSFSILYPVYLKLKNLFKNNGNELPVFIWRYPDWKDYPENKLVMIFEGNSLNFNQKIYNEDTVYWNGTVKYEEAK